LILRPSSIADVHTPAYSSCDTVVEGGNCWLGTRRGPPGPDSKTPVDRIIVVIDVRGNDFSPQGFLEFALVSAGNWRRSNNCDRTSGTAKPPEAALCSYETGESFKNPSSSASDPAYKTDTPTAPDPDKLLQELEEGVGVGNGVRTRDFRSHSPALCH
jgi:hypothetical protein